MIPHASNVTTHITSIKFGHRFVSEKMTIEIIRNGNFLVLHERYVNNGCNSRRLEADLSLKKSFGIRNIFPHYLDQFLKHAITGII